MARLSDLSQRIWQRRPHWLFAAPAAKPLVRLTHKNIYIFPNLAGFGYLLLCVLLWVMAVNYQNNLIYILLFVLLCVFVVTILHSFANIRGLTVSAMGETLGATGSVQGVPICVDTDHCEDVVLGFRDNPSTRLTLYPKRAEQAEFTLPLTMPVRGRHDLPRLWIKSHYPLGLFTTWARVSLKSSVFAYPLPLACQWPQAMAATPEDEQDQPKLTCPKQAVGHLGDVLYQFRPFHGADKPSQIFWPAYARGAGLVVADYREEVPQSVSHQTLDYQMFAQAYPTATHEMCLSYLCFWLLKRFREGHPVNLLLPHQQVLDIRETAQLNMALKALADAKS